MTNQSAITEQSLDTLAQISLAFITHRMIESEYTEVWKSI